MSSLAQYRSGMAPDGQNGVRRPPGDCVAGLFLTNGAIFANLLPGCLRSRPIWSTRNTALDRGALQALASGLTAGALIRRFRSSRVGSPPNALPVYAAAVRRHRCSSPSRCSSPERRPITDVAVNAHGLRIQRNYGRSIINSHAVCRSAPSSWVDGCWRHRLVHPALDSSGRIRIVFGAVALIAYPFCPRPDHHDTCGADGRRREVRVGIYGAGGAGWHRIAGAAVEDLEPGIAYLRDSRRRCTVAFGTSRWSVSVHRRLRYPGRPARSARPAQAEW
jgi:hypothetical protein